MKSYSSYNKIIDGFLHPKLVDAIDRLPCQVAKI